MSTHKTRCDFLVDLYQNAVESGASRVGISLLADEERWSLTVTDNGCGMDEATLRRAQDPFWSDGKKHPNRKVGLGLPFVIQTLEMTEGRFRIVSSKEPPRGTEVEAVFNRTHWDTPPVGDLPACLSQVMAWPGDHEIVLVWNGSSVTRSDLREALGSFDDPEARGMLQDYFRENGLTEVME